VTPQVFAGLDSSAIMPLPIFVFWQIVVVCDQCIRITGFQLCLEPVEVEQQLSQFRRPASFLQVISQMLEK
jgi:hypothetical protein